MANLLSRTVFTGTLTGNDIFYGITDPGGVPAEWRIPLSKLADLYATAAQGVTADSAVQPGDLATVAFTGAYANLSGLPTLGTLAAFNDAPSDGSQYARIDGGWAVVAGGGAVDSVFGRVGVVTAQAGDYTAAQVTNAAAVNAENVFTATQTVNNADLDLAGTGIYKLVGSRVLHRTGNSFYAGVGAGNLTATGAENVAVGNGAMAAVTSGNTNVAVGDLALSANQTGASNIAIGRRSLINFLGSNTIAIGLSALSSLTSGVANVAIGNTAGQAIGTGGSNTLIGFGAAVLMTSSFNVCVGTQAGDAIVGGNANVMIGYSADGLAAGVGQIAIGYQATCNATAQIVLGTQAAGTAANQMVVGSTGYPVNEFRQVMQTALTNTIQNAFIFKHNTSGTPAAGFGTALVFQGESSTTESQEMGRLTAEWATATHASRKTRSKWTVYDTAEREAIRIEADGAAAMIGFLGANASPRQTFGAATAGATYGATEQLMLQKCYDALRLFGFGT